MPTAFISGLSDDVKPFIDGSPNENRYPLVNSRNRNRKIIRSGSTVTTQNLGIDAPTIAPTGAGGTGSNLFYKYVYVNKFFQDPLALEDDNHIRSDASPVSAAVASQTTPATIQGTASTDTQVTHVWLYLSDSAEGPFYRQSANYEVANSGTPTWTSETSVPTDGFILELDNGVPDTCRIVRESNGFYLYAGFVPLTETASVTIGSSTVTITSGTWPDGILALYLQFTGDTTGGPNGDGVFIANYATSTTLSLVNADGSADTYNGPSNKVDAAVRIWRASSVVQISKRYNPDGIPGTVDPDFILFEPGNITGIAKPSTGYALRIHSNNNGKKLVEIVDFAQGVPPRRFQVCSNYAMTNPRAEASAGPRMFYYDFDCGVIEDKGSVHIPITLSVIPNLIRSLGSESQSLSEMEYDETRNLLFLSVCPSGYSRAYYMIVYNLTTNAWNLWFMLPDVNAMRRVKDDSTSEVVVKMGSSFGSYTSWPSENFNEAVGTSRFGVLTTTDDATHLTDSAATFPTTGDKLKDRWVMVWNDLADIPVYQFARISDNTATRLTLDTFIGPNSTVQLNPLPQTGWAYWVGPIQSILGPSWDFNSIPDEDGQVMDVNVTTSNLDAGMTSKLSLYRNFETEPIMGTTFVHNLYADSSGDPDHQSVKLGNVSSVEAVGVTGWQITDNNESAMSIKAVVKRVKAISETLNQRSK